MLDGVWVLPVLAMILIVGPALYAHLPAFWPIPTMFLGATAAASAIGFINMIGNLGGFVGPYVVGKSATEHAAFSDALLKLTPFPIIAAFTVLAVSLYRRRHASSEAGRPKCPRRRTTGVPIVHRMSSPHVLEADAASWRLCRPLFPAARE